MDVDASILKGPKQPREAHTSWNEGIIEHPELEEIHKLHPNPNIMSESTIQMLLELLLSLTGQHSARICTS